jgi:hypothetical protein
MNPTSRRRLRQLLGDFDIPVILTGHTHRPDVRRHCVYSPKRRRWFPFLEACCGTTTQANHVPPHWPAVFGRRELDPNTFLVHRLVTEGDRALWRTETWGRSHLDDGFRPAPENAQGAPWRSELQVWPRP